MYNLYMINCIIFLAILFFIYYKINLNYNIFTNKYHYYFGGFIILVLFINYLMNYQKGFVYKMASNIKNTNNIQMHELLPDYTNKNKSDAIVKNYLLNKQLYKCQYCNRDIDINYINEYNLSYITPIESGGQVNIDNLCLICPTCNNLY